MVTKLILKAKFMVTIIRRYSRLLLIKVRHIYVTLYSDQSINHRLIDPQGTNMAVNRLDTTLSSRVIAGNNVYTAR